MQHLARDVNVVAGPNTFNVDVLDGKSQDDRPDHAQRHLQVAVHDLWQKINTGSE